MMKATVFPPTKADSRTDPPGRAGFGGRLVTWAGNLVTSSMHPAIQLRLAAFIVALVMVFAAIVWTAHTSWQRFGALRERLNSDNRREDHDQGDDKRREAQLDG